MPNLLKFLVFRNTKGRMDDKLIAGFTSLQDAKDYGDEFLAGDHTEYRIEERTPS